MEDAVHYSNLFVGFHLLKVSYSIPSLWSLFSYLQFQYTKLIEMKQTEEACGFGLPKPKRSIFSDLGSPTESLRSNTADVP